MDWLIEYKHSKDRAEAFYFGTHLRGKGFIRHIEFQPVVKDSDDEFYKIVNLEEDSFTGNTNTNSNMSHMGYTSNSILDRDHSNVSSIHKGYGRDGINGRRSLYTSSKMISKEDAPNLLQQSSHSTYSTHRATVATMVGAGGGTGISSPTGGTGNAKRKNGDSMSSNMTSSEIIRNTQHIQNRTSIMLGQMGKGRTTRKERREQMIKDLFTYIIRKETKASMEEMRRTVDASPEILLQEDMHVDGPDHPDIRKLLLKIERKFKKCDEHSRGSLGKEEFNRFLIKCGVILHQQDLSVIFKLFDKNATG